MYLIFVMIVFKKRNRLIYICIGEVERNWWNLSYEKLFNVNYVFYYFLSYLFISE